MKNVLFLASFCIACSSTPDTTGPIDGDASPTADPSTSSAIDPFAPMADTSEGLINVSGDLNALMEQGALAGACDAWRADRDNRHKELLCGKSMFFYEGFDTIGIPTAILDFGGTKFPAEMGVAYAKLGLIQDPYGPQGRPLGFGPGAPLGDDGTVETLAMTCASCHFGQLPDGRYAVGAPNHNYRYGTHMLALTLFPSTADPAFDPRDHHPDAMAQIRPVIDRIEGDRMLSTALLFQLLPMMNLSDQAATLDYDTEGLYASWEPGTMDFLIAPLPIDDEVHTISKISHLYAIPTPDEQAAAGMDSALLAWTGSAESLRRFLAGFVRIGEGNEGTWTPEDMEPLAAYIESLRPPTPPTTLDDAAMAHGEQVFHDAGCLDCHQGPRGSGLQAFTFDEIGTDAAMADFGAPDADDQPCCGLSDPTDPPLTRGVKSPRLVGLWGMERFLHNGSVSSLEALFCLEERAGISEWAYGDQGHEYGCDLSSDDRVALIAWLNQH